MNIKSYVFVCMLVGLSVGIHGAHKKSFKELEKKAEAYVLRNFNEIPSDVFDRFIREESIGNGVRVLSTDHLALAAYWSSIQSERILKQLEADVEKRRTDYIAKHGGPDVRREAFFEEDEWHTRFTKRELRFTGTGKSILMTFTVSKIHKGDKVFYAYQSMNRPELVDEQAKAKFEEFTKDYEKILGIKADN